MQGPLVEEFTFARLGRDEVAKPLLKPGAVNQAKANKKAKQRAVYA